MKHNPIALALITTNLLVGCGGGSGSVSAPEIAIAPDNSTDNGAVTSPSTIIKTGVISGFGSIYLDGQRYLTDSSSISVNGLLGQDISDLKVGMKISLAVNESADGSTPEAVEVNYENDIEGVITAIDRNNRQLLLAGTVIIYNDVTHFINVSEVSLSVGDRIEVSGYLDASSTFVATYIELDDYFDNDSYEYTTGLVSGHDPLNQTFQLNSLTVDYSGATIEGQIADNLTIKVSGNVLGTVLTAHEVETVQTSYHGDFNEVSIAHYEVEGIVSAYDSVANSLTINGLSYGLATNLQIIGGTTISVNEFVEVYIDPTSNQIFKIEIKQQHQTSDGRVKGIISAIDSNNRSISLNGQTYFFTDNTRVEDDSNQYFSFDSLMINDQVEIVYISNNGVLQIQRIERENEQEYFQEWELKGVATDVDAANQTFSVNGVVVSLTAAVRYLVNDAIVTAEQFFTQLSASPTSMIEVEGYYDIGGAFVPVKVEIEQTGSSNNEHSGGNNQSIDSDEDMDNSNHDHEFGSDNDDDGVGYVEIEGTVSQVLNASSFILNGREIRLDNLTELEVNDVTTNLTDFMANVSVNTRIEIEGYWVDSTYIYALEAEIEFGDHD